MVAMEEFKTFDFYKLSIFLSYSFILLANLKNHIGVNHKETNIFACKVCDFNSNSKEALKAHEKTHSGK